MEERNKQPFLSTFYTCEVATAAINYEETVKRKVLTNFAPQITWILTFFLSARLLLYFLIIFLSNLSCYLFSLWITFSLYLSPLFFSQHLLSLTCSFIYLCIFLFSLFLHPHVFISADIFSPVTSETIGTDFCCCSNLLCAGNKDQDQLITSHCSLSLAESPVLLLIIST